MTANIPFIPDNAPFTPEQRAWLNGLMAGIFSSTPSLVQGETKASLRIAVLYASQSGTAEGLARKLAKELKAQGHVPAVSTLVGYTPAALAEEKYAVFLASTYGEGDAPDGVQPFYEHLCLERFPRYENLSYAVFALGDVTMRTTASSAKTLTPNSLRWGPIGSATGSIATWMWTRPLNNGRQS